MLSHSNVVDVRSIEQDSTWS